MTVIEFKDDRSVGYAGQMDQLYKPDLNPGETFEMISSAKAREILVKLGENGNYLRFLWQEMTTQHVGDKTKLRRFWQQVITFYFANLDRPQYVRFLTELDSRGNIVKKPTGLGFPIALSPLPIDKPPTKRK